MRSAGNKKKLTDLGTTLNRVHPGAVCANCAQEMTGPWLRSPGRASLARCQNLSGKTT